MVTSALAVVGRHHDQQPLCKPPLFETAQQPAELIVDVRNLLVVGMQIFEAPAGGRCVGVVGIEEVDPGEEALARLERRGPSQEAALLTYNSP